MPAHTSTHSDPASPRPDADRTGGEAVRTAEAAASKAGASPKGRSSGERGEALDRVAASLRNAYESTVTEAVPDSILDLLRQLD